MKQLLVVVGLAFLLGACGDEQVKWDCACTASACETLSTITTTACALESDGEGAVRVAVEQCGGEIANQGCTSGTCLCQCARTADPC